MVTNQEITTSNPNQELYLRCVPKQPHHTGGNRNHHRRHRESQEEMIRRIVGEVLNQALNAALAPILVRLDNIERRLDNVERVLHEHHMM